MRYSLAIVLFFLAGPVQAEDELLKSRFMTFRYDNDVFLGIDRYYTQGIQFEYSAPFLQKSPVNYILPTISDVADRISIFVEQQCFTPTSINTSDVQLGDHPYGGIMIFGQKRASHRPLQHQILSSEFILGALGPCAKCEETQKGIHRATNNDIPLGWGNQLSNTFVINYNLSYEQGIINWRWMTFSALTRVRLGTLHDDAQLGAGLRFGKVSGAFAVPDQEYSHKLVWSAFANGNLEIVAYNATLQGGLFNKGDIYSLSSENVERIAFVGKAGVQLAYWSLVLELSLSVNSPGFSGGLDHRYGRIFLRYFF